MYKVHCAVGSGQQPVEPVARGVTWVKWLGGGTNIGGYSQTNLSNDSYTKTDCFSVINILFYINFVLKIKTKFNI